MLLRPAALLVVSLLKSNDQTHPHICVDGSYRTKPIEGETYLQIQIISHINASDVSAFRVVLCSNSLSLKLI